MSRTESDFIEATVLVDWDDADAVLKDLHEHTSPGWSCPLCSLSYQIREALAARALSPQKPKARLSSGTGKRKARGSRSPEGTETP